MSSRKSHCSQKIEIERGRYGVCKKQYWNLDCVNLYIELLILLNCELISASHPCTNLLRFVVEITRNKWDNIRFFDFECSLEIAKILNFL